MNVLVINSGSSSIKYKLYAMPDEQVLLSGRIENIGRNAAMVETSPGKTYQSRPVECADHSEGVKKITGFLADQGSGGVSIEEIDAVGHRVVHGGNRFCAPEIITGEVLDKLGDLQELAPLHLPLNLACIRTCLKTAPHAQSVAIFDTAFFHDLPEHTRMYPVPVDWYSRWGVRRYGFHGISYEYVTTRAAEILGRSPARLKLIATHLGNGSSIMAFDQGRALDTSMGFTPLEGLMMGTRSGNFDPAVFPHIMAKSGMSVDKILDVLNKKSGLLGVSGSSHDMRAISAAMKNGDARAKLAFDMFVHILRKYIGAYLFAMGGTDAIVFTGGIGENSPEVRQAVFEPLSSLGLTVDAGKNSELTNGKSGIIDTGDGPSRILVVPTDEELMIARSTYETISGSTLKTPTPGEKTEISA